MSIEKRIFQLQSMSNVIICIYKNFAVKNSGASCLTFILYLSNLKMKIQHAKKYMTIHSQFLFVIALWLRHIAVS